jgi:hypothetical protein
MKIRKEKELGDEKWWEDIIMREEYGRKRLPVFRMKKQLEEYKMICGCI